MSHQEPELVANSPRIVELRRYVLRPGARDTLVTLFDREFVESQEELGMRIVGQFTDVDDPDSFVWVRGFEDMERRRRSLEAFYGGPVWKAHAAAANATMIDIDNVRLLRPLSGLMIQPSARAAPGATALPPGLVVATILPLTASSAPGFPDYFRSALEPALRGCGISVLATYVTEHSPNTFPALPVREGEDVFVWFAVHEDEPQQVRLTSRLESSPGWTEALAHARRQWFSGPPETLRLRPTSRSALHA